MIWRILVNISWGYGLSPDQHAPMRIYYKLAPKEHIEVKI